MDRLDMAIELIREAQRERDRIEAMEAELSSLSREDPDYWSKSWEITSKYWGSMPHKSIVNDNLKLARRILLGEYMK
jgi:hypothetical protein